MSQQTFNIPIPNERIKSYSLITFIILSINFFGFGLVFLKTNGTLSYLAIACIILNAVPWCYYLLQKKHINFPVIEIALAFSAIVWFFLDNWIMAIFLILFIAIGFFANKKQIIIFDQSGIIYPSFLPKKYTWPEVQQVIWKDDMLTIDLKNNKLMQFNIEREFAKEFNFDNFNKYCSTKL